MLQLDAFLLAGGRSLGSTGICPVPLPDLLVHLSHMVPRNHHQNQEESEKHKRKHNHKDFLCKVFLVMYEPPVLKFRNHYKGNFVGPNHNGVKEVQYKPREHHPPVLLVHPVNEENIGGDMGDQIADIKQCRGCRLLVEFMDFLWNAESGDENVYSIVYSNKY